MGKIAVIYSDNFRDYLDELTQLLYKDEYFGFIEDAFVYTDKIYDFIEANIENPFQNILPPHIKNLESFL